MVFAMSICFQKILSFLNCSTSALEVCVLSTVGDDVTGEGRTRPNGEREMEVAVLHIDHRVDKLAPLLTRARCVRLDGLDAKDSVRRFDAFQSSGARQPRLAWMRGARHRSGGSRHYRPR